jgi:hypothetical protein
MRKKTLLLFVVSLSSATICFGQIAKGSVLLGGDLSAYTEHQTDNNGIVVRNNGFFISPLAGKAIKNNLFLGGYFNLGISKDEGTNASNAFKSHSYGVGIFLRKYGGIKNNFFGFLQANLGAN